MNSSRSHQVFLSYSGEDESFVELVALRLQGGGVVDIERHKFDLRSVYLL